VVADLSSDPDRISVVIVDVVDDRVQANGQVAQRDTPLPYHGPRRRDYWATTSTTPRHVVGSTLAAMVI